MLLKAQMHGGIIQGVGQALMEDIVYDETGQLISGSLMDYCVPRADGMCFMDIISAPGSDCIKPDWCQRRRRIWADGGFTRDDQCRCRRAQTTGCCPYRHARDPAQNLANYSKGQSRKGCLSNGNSQQKTGRIMMSDPSIAGKVCVVTGGSRGLGRQ